MHGVENRKSVVSKLRRLLSHPSMSARRLALITPDDEQALTDVPRIFLYSGALAVTDHNDAYVFLSTNLGHGLQMSLTCSKRFFSDWYGSDQPMISHSGSYDFLEGDLSAQFEAIIVVVGIRENTIVATPLFLALPLNSTLTI
jgi:hypothetical protein